MIASRGRVLCAVALALLLGRTLLAQCQLDHGGLSGKGTFNSQTSIRTIRVTVPDVPGPDAVGPTVNSGTRAAMVNALSAWSDLKDATGIEFVPVRPNQLSDMQIRKDNAALGQQGSKCAGGIPGGDIVFDSNFDAIGENPSETVAAKMAHVLKHELGHVLNLTNVAAGTSSIMNQATGGSTCQDAIDNHMPPTSQIQPSDAETARICANKRDPVPDPDNAFNESQQNGDCWDVFLVTLIFEMDDQGHWGISDVNREQLYTVCDEGDPYPN